MGFHRNKATFEVGVWNETYAMMHLSVFLFVTMFTFLFRHSAVIDSGHHCCACSSMMVGRL